MGKGILQNSSAFTKLMFSAFLVISSFLITLAAGLVIALPIFSMGFLELIDNMSNIVHPQYPGLLRYFQIVQSIGLFIIPPFILAWFFSGSTLKYLFLNRKAGWKTIILTTVIMLSAIPLINLVAHYNSKIALPESMSAIEEWMQRTEESAKRLTEMFLKADSPKALLFNIFMIAIIPAIGEELLFRGIIQRLFAEWTGNRHAGIWISAIIFSAMHLQFYGFIPRTLLGILFGYLLIWSGRMWVPITAHFVNNAVAVIVYYLIQNNKISESLETLGIEKGDWGYLFLSILFLSLFMILFYTRERMNTGNYRLSKP